MMAFWLLVLLALFTQLLAYGHSLSAVALGAAAVVTLVRRGAPMAWDYRELVPLREEPVGVLNRVWGPGGQELLVGVLATAAVMPLTLGGAVAWTLLLAPAAGTGFAWLARRGPEWKLGPAKVRAVRLAMGVGLDASSGRFLLLAAIAAPTLAAGAGMPGGGLASIGLLALLVRPHLAAGVAAHKAMIAGVEATRKAPLPVKQGTSSGASGGASSERAKTWSILRPEELPKLADVGGYEREKQQVLRIARLVRAEWDQSLAESRGSKAANTVRVTGALLHGDPGVGKSLLAEAAAQAAGLPVINVSSSELRMGFVGDSGKAAADLFAFAAANAPVLIVIDEIDDILKDRAGTDVPRSGADDELAAAFLQAMTSLPAGVAIIGTTNFLSRLDPASRSRFDAEIGIPMPDLEARKAIVRSSLRAHTTRRQVDVDAVAAATSGLSGRRIDKLVSAAASAAALDGDRVINTEDVLAELRAATMASTALRPVPWTSVIAQKWVLDRLKSVAEAVRAALPSMAKAVGGLRPKPPKGILLYGPSGTGKTLMVRALATACQADSTARVTFISKKGSDFTSPYINKGPEKVSTIFAEARAAAGGGVTILFIDEFEVLAKDRASGGMNQHGEDQKVLDALLAEMDGIGSDGRVLVIAATNHRSQIDPAILQRLPLQIEIPLPDQECRERLLELFTGQLPLAEDVDLAACAAASDGLSGRQIESWIDEAVAVAASRGADEVHQEDLAAALCDDRAGAA